MTSKNQSLPRIGQLPFPENTAVPDERNPFEDTLKNTRGVPYLGGAKEPLVERSFRTIDGKTGMEIQVIRGNVPSKSNCYIIVTIKSKDPNKRGFSSLAKTKALKQYEESFYMQCNLYRNANIEGYFEFYMDVFYENNRSDLDNSLKVVLDCLQKVKAFANDNKCSQIHLRRFIDKNNPRIEFWIKPAMQ